MSLEKGFSLGKYEIEKLLGTGGMGEVYLAKDTELDRLVAIKFLSSDFSADDKLRNRFMQEVRSVSALNHPHILTVFEFGNFETEEKQLHYFVSEYVQGETLREFLKKEKLILGDILDIVIQIASALASAHEAGIIHRDIKPENIMIRHDGYAKILDFGLAKPIDNEEDSAIDLEANTKVLTNPGTVMGTVNYMSPEQARGESTDARTDIWSLGVLFYEMITGKLPFEGKTTSHTIVSILENQPSPLNEFLQPVLESLQFIIDELLVKNCEERCQTAKELQGKLKRLKKQIDTEAELDRSVSPSILRSTNDEIPHSQKPNMTVANANTTADVTADSNLSSAEFLFNQIKKTKTGAVIAIIFGILLLGIISLAIYQFFNNNSAQTAENKAPIKMTKLTNNGQSFEPVISPDGKNVAFLYDNSGKTSFRLRQISTNSSVDLIPEIKDSFFGATFSPDGNDLFYVSGKKGNVLKSLYKVSVLGGEIKKLFDDVDSEVSFSPDGKKVVFLRVLPKEKKKTLVVANADGTNEETIIKRDFNTSIVDLAWSPDGKTIAFNFYGQDEKGYFVFVDSFDLEKKTEGRITTDRWRNIHDLEWLKDNSGLIIAARDFASAPGSPHQIWKIPFPKGEAKKITNDLNNYVTVSVDKNSQKLITQISNVSSSLWVNSASDQNETKKITTKSLTSNTLSWTADEKIIYTSNESGNNDLWIVKSDGKDKKQLTSDEAFENYPSATPDGKYIVYETNRNVGWSIWRMNTDGSNQTELQGNIGNSFPQITPDSRWIIYAKNNSSLWKTSIDGGKPEKILDDRIFGHKISPDGQQVAYLTRSSDINADFQMKIVSIKNGETIKTLETPVKNRFFNWSPDGKALDFVLSDTENPNIQRLTLEENSEPKQVSDWNLKSISNFKWSPDGKQIAIASGESNSDLVLIEDF